MIAGYEPSHVETLRRRATSALHELRGIHLDDPAADGAMSAVAQLIRALDGQLLPAVAAIGEGNPLIAGARSGPFWPIDWRPRTWESTSTKWSGFENRDLIIEVRIEFESSIDGLTPEAFDELVMEFSNRAAIDPAFAELVISEAAFDPLIGAIVAAGTFSDQVVVGVLSTLVFAEFVIDDALSRNAAIVALLERIVDRPDLALDMLSDRDLTTGVFTFNHTPFTAGQVPATLLADLVVSGLVLAPAVDPSRRGEAASVLPDFVDLAALEWFDDGFYPEVAQAIAIVIGAYSNEFLETMPARCGLTLVEGDHEIHLGTREELVEFFSALMHDELTRGILAGILADAAHRALDGDATFSTVDVSALSLLFNDAIDHENSELDQAADRTIGIIDFAFDLVEFGAKAALDATGVGKFTSFLIGMGIDATERVVVDQVDAGDIGAPNFAVIGDLIIRVATLRRTLGDLDTATWAVADALERLDRIEVMFDEADVTYGAIERELIAFESTLAHVIDVQALDERVENGRYAPRVSSDQSDVCDRDVPSLKR